MLQRLKNVVPWHAQALADFYDFTESLLAASVIYWTFAVEKWEMDNMKVNPFVPTVKSKSYSLWYFLFVLISICQLPLSMVYSWMWQNVTLRICGVKLQCLYMKKSSSLPLS